jgi:hypothetical protein
MSTEVAPEIVAQPTEQLSPIRGRTVFLALLIGGGAMYYAVRYSMLGGSLIDMPWLTLFVFAALQPILARLFRLRAADTIVIFVFVSIVYNAILWMYGHIQCLAVLRYFADPTNQFQRLADQYIPKWFGPTDIETIRVYWEGSPERASSLGPWLAPMALWTVFFMALWATQFCITALLRRYWTDHEHLAFPQVSVPLYIADAGTGRMRPKRGFWAEPLMWIGFGVTFLHFLTIMLHGLNPNIPTLTMKTDVGAFLTERPFDSLRPLWFCYNPMLTGFAYFAPQDLCFSMWFFYLFYDGAIKLFYAVSGLPPHGAPYTHEQTAGAFFAVALLYLWASRGYLRGVASSAARGRPIATPGEPNPWADPLTARTAVIGLVCGFVALCAWYMIAGMSWWVAAPFFVMILLFATIYTRGRAETGVYPIYLVPFFQASRQLKSFLGSGPLMPHGSFANLTLLASALPLHYGFVAENMTFQIEGLRLGEECRIKTSHMTTLILFAALVGIAMKFYTELSVNREFGAFGPSGGADEGGWWTGVVRGEYQEVGQVMSGTPLQPDWYRNGYTIGAFVFSLALALIRATFPRSPLNPLGFALTVHYGVIHWGPFLAAWLAKSIILRIGGGRLYHKLIPLFVGLIVGQVFALGVVWNLFALFTREEWRALAVPVQG